MKYFATLLILLVLPLPAFAYIDPASGSAIMSAVIGFIVAVALAIKTYWYKLKSLFSGKKGNKDSDGQNDSQ